MNNKRNFIIIIICISFILFLITKNKSVLESINFSISIWKDNLFPTLFPFFVVSNILIEYGFIDIISPLFKKIMNKLYNLPSSCSFVFIISLFSGFPSGAKWTISLLKNNYITKEEAERLLTFTHYSNPLFVLGFIGSIIFNNINIGIIILISHILSGIITGIFFKQKKVLIKTINNKCNKDYLPIGTVLTSSIMDSLNTLFLLFGIVCVFTLGSTFLNTIFSLNEPYKSILSGILEMTQGIKNISYLDISIYFKVLLSVIFISFGGLSVHLQVISLISSFKLKYKTFLLARIIHSIIACSLVSILYLITC